MEEFLIIFGQTLVNLLTFIAFSVTGLYLLSKWKRVVDFLMTEEKGVKSKIIVIIVAGSIIMAASEYALVMTGAKVNVRDFIAIFSGILAGPIVGIVVGLIGGIYRMNLGGWSAFPCGVATICAGLIGAYLSKYRGYTIKSITLRQVGIIATIMGVWEFIHVEVLVPLLGAKPVMEGFMIMTKSFLLPMVLINMVGIAIFLLVCKDAITIKKQQETIRFQAKRVAEIMKGLKRYEKIIEKKRK